MTQGDGRAKKEKRLWNCVAIRDPGLLGIAAGPGKTTLARLRSLHRQNTGHVHCENNELPWRPRFSGTGLTGNENTFQWRSCRSWPGAFF
jgi:hypothetical protein